MSATTTTEVPRSRTSHVVRELGPPLSGIVGLIAAWAVVAAVTSSDVVPSPLATWGAFLDGMADGTIPEATLKT